MRQLSPCPRASSTKWKMVLTALFFLSKICVWDHRYILFLFSPVDREVMRAEPLPEVGDLPGDGVDYMCNLIADDKLNVLYSYARYPRRNLISQEQPVLDLDRPW
jgi:hypothetical protein